VNYFKGDYSVRPTRRARTGPRIGSEEWIKERIRLKYINHIRPQVNEYWYIIFRGSVDADYNCLGKKLSGAPDDREGDFEYPIRLHYTPHWVKKVIDNFKTCWTVKDYIQFHWLQEVLNYPGLPHSEQSSAWYFYKEGLEIELISWEVLKHFKGAEGSSAAPLFPEVAHRIYQQLLDLPEEQFLALPRIDSILIEHPIVEELQSRVRDPRPIPPSALGEKIPESFTKWYLDTKFLEWSALGGLQHWREGLRLSASYNQDLHRRFYWDLWKDIEQFQWEAFIVTKGLKKLQQKYLKFKAEWRALKEED
jgi:hypothetical protein